MSILDKALEIANKQKEEEQKFLEERNLAFVRMQEQLQAMKDLVIDELKKIDGQHDFKVQFLEKEDWKNVFAYLTYNKYGKDFDSNVAWFKAKIVSGTFDASDDCRGIEYTEPRIRMRIYPKVRYSNPNFSANDWDTQELRECSNGGFEFSFSSVDKAPKFFEDFAKQLALWLV